MSPTVRNGRGERSEFAVALEGSPSGPIERRVAADHERAGFASSRPTEGLPAPKRHPWVQSPEHIAAVMAPPRLEVVPPYESRRSIAVTASPEPVTPEEPVMAIEPPPPASLSLTDLDSLRALDVALREAIDAWEALEQARLAEIRWTAACKALESAWRRTGLRGAPTSVEDRPYFPPSTIDEVLARRREPVPGAEVDGGEGLSESSTDIPEIIPELADDAPEVVTKPAAGGGPGPSALPPKQARILATVVRLKGDRKAASAELRVPITNIENQLESIGRKGLLPIELIPLLPARFAKYSAV